MHMLHVMMARHVPEGFIDEYQAPSFLQYPSIDLGTRYFTARRDDPQGVAIPFENTVDPKGLLSSMAKDTYFHGIDNEVLYYALSNDIYGTKPPRQVHMEIKDSYIRTHIHSHCQVRACRACML